MRSLEKLGKWSYSRFPTADVTGMEAEEVGTAEPMGGLRQEAEIGAGAADLGERKGTSGPLEEKGEGFVLVTAGH